MTANEKIPWKRLTVEAAAIVGSILLAFAIDAWWSARQLDNEEQQTLRQLQAEFQTNAALLAERRGRHEDILNACETILSLTGPESEDLLTDTANARSAIERITIWWTYDPQMGVLAGLTQSGGLRIISSDPLRNALASWPSEVQDLVEDEIYAQEFTAGLLEPYLNENLAMRNVVLHPSVNKGKFSDNLVGLLAERKFENLVHNKLGLTIQVLREYDGLAALVDEILTLIVAEIEVD
jgi:hypothetical protein